MAKELHANTYQQVKGYVDGALNIVNELDVEHELRSVAFVAACNMLSQKQVLYTQSEMMPDVLPAMAIPGDRRGH